MEPPPLKKTNVKLIVAIVLALLLVPVGMIYVIFPWLSQPAFRSIEEIDPALVESLSVQLLNHPGGQDDVGPVKLHSQDFARLLEPLRDADRIDVQPPAAFNGEYRVRFQDGRRGTIRLRWARDAFDYSTPIAALVGGVAEQGSNPPRWRYTVYMQIGNEKYRAKVDALRLFSIARECEPRGTR